MPPPKRPFITKKKDVENVSTKSREEVVSHLRSSWDLISSQVKASQFLSILSLLTNQKVESFDIEKVGVPRSPSKVELAEPFFWQEWNASRLGSGTTCSVVQHSIQQQTKTLGSGTVVALKRFQYAGMDQSNIDKTYAAIHQEIQVFCHPKLRNHANICRLEYVAWEPNAIFPSLAMELAEYGSLEYVLTSPGFGLSYIQKCHLTIDVAIGIAVLHKYNFLHGDIKPGNIIIQKHDKRGMIAKILDFGGAANRILAQTKPTMGTETWWSPELVYGDEIVDWEKVDAYAFGLVVASIWSRTYHFVASKLSSCCILDRFMSPDFTDGDRRHRLKIMKGQPDDEIDSVLRRCQIVTAVPAPILMLDKLLFATLSRSPGQRQSILDIFRDGGGLLRSFAQSCDRDMSADLDILQHDSDSDSPFQPTSYIFEAEDTSYAQRKPFFQILVYSHVEKCLQGIEEVLNIPSNDIEDNSNAWTPDPNRYLSDVVTSLNTIFEGWKVDRLSRAYVGQFAQFAAISNVLNMGTQFQEPKFLAYVYASICSDGKGLGVVHPLMQSFRETCLLLRAPSAVARKTFLVVEALRGSGARCSTALTLLGAHYPHIYFHTCRILELKGRLPFEEDAECVDIIAAYQIAESLATASPESCLASQHIGRAQELLKCESSNTSLLSSCNMKFMEYLSCLEDESAATLARLYPSAFDDETAQPVSQAIIAGRPKLAFTIFRLHFQYHIQIEHPLQIGIIAALCHAPDIFFMVFHLAGTQKLFEDQQETHQRFVNQMLSCAIDGDGFAILRRRINNGSSYNSIKKETITQLLQYGADPTAADIENNKLSPLNQAVVIDDRDSLQLFIDHCERQKEDFTLFYTALGGCTRMFAQACFSAILDNFPQFVQDEIQGKSVIDMAEQEGSRFYGTGLIIETAARCSDPYFIRELLKRGGNPLEYLNIIPPLVGALCQGHIETAEILYNHHTSQERDDMWNPNPRSNNLTATGILVNTLNEHRRPGTLDGMKWLIKKNGHRFWARKHEPAWDYLLKKLQPKVTTDAFLDRQMLKLLFDCFSDELQLKNEEGIAPIHLAVLWGNLDALNLLLDKVDINLETGVEARDFAGRTALNIALQTIDDDDLPENTSRGSELDVSQWKEMTREILRILIMANAQLGENSTEAERIKHIGALHGNVNTFAHAGINNTKRFKQWYWPRGPPRDHSSIPELEASFEESRLLVWMHDGTAEHISRPLAEQYLSFHLRLSNTPSKVPNEYRSWLAETARQMDVAWKSKDQNKDVTEHNNAELEKECFYHHNYGMQKFENSRVEFTGKGKAVVDNKSMLLDNDPTIPIVELPRLRKIHYIGPVPDENSREGADLMHMIGILEQNSLPQDFDARVLISDTLTIICTGDFPYPSLVDASQEQLLDPRGNTLECFFFKPRSDRGPLDAIAEARNSEEERVLALAIAASIETQEESDKQEAAESSGDEDSRLIKAMEMSLEIDEGASDNEEELERKAIALSLD